MTNLRSAKILSAENKRVETSCWIASLVLFCWWMWMLTKQDADSDVFLVWVRPLTVLMTVGFALLTRYRPWKYSQFPYVAMAGGFFPALMVVYEAWLGGWTLANFFSASVFCSVMILSLQQVRSVIMFAMMYALMSLVSYFAVSSPVIPLLPIGMVYSLIFVTGFLSARMRTLILDRLDAEIHRRDALFLAMNEGMMVHGPDGQVLNANHAAREILRVEEEEFSHLLDRRISWVFKNELQDVVLQEELPPIKARMTRSPILNVKLQFHKVGHPPVHLVMSSVPVWISEKESDPHVITTFQDITIEQNQNRLLEEQRMYLFGSAKLTALGDMAAGIAHEINNPLAVIRGKVELGLRALANETATPEMLRGSLCKIDEKVERIQKIILSLRALAAHGDEEEVEVIRVQELVDIVMDVATGRVSKVGASLELKVDPALEVQCRRTHTKQILLNLIANAVDAIEHHSEKKIRIETRLSSDAVELCVIDSGHGVDVQYRHRLMQPFFTTKEIGRGTGLGLSLSHRMAQSQGGQLDYLWGQKPSTFVLRIPKAPPQVRAEIFET